MNSKTTQWRIGARIGLTYALTISLMTLPAPLQLSQRVLGHSADTWIFYWNNWWLEQAITEGHNWLFTPYLFYPQGASLTVHSNSFLNSLLALPLKHLLGPVAAYNLTILFGLWMSAVGMFLLTHEITKRLSAGFLAGFVFALTPYHLTQALAHGHLGAIHWWPFFALFLRRALHRQRTMDILYAGLFAALTLWTGLQLAVMLALWAAIYIGWYVLQGTVPRVERRRLWSRIAGGTGMIMLVALILSSPVVLPIAKEWHQVTDPAVIRDEGSSRQTDLLAYLLPPIYHSLVGPYTFPLYYERFETNTKYMPYLGYTVLGLALISLRSRRKEKWLWLLSIVLWVVLATGSVLRVNGTLYPQVPLPYRFIGQFFPISAVRVPDRLNLLVVFSLSVLVGLGADYLARRRRWLLVPIILLIFLEYICIPLPMWGLPSASPFFQQMAQEQTLYGVVDCPMGYTVSKKWLYYQTLHGKPIVEGHISRYTLEDYAFILSNPLLRALYRTAEKPPYLPGDASSSEAGPVTALGPTLRALETSGVRYILLHKSNIDADLDAHFQRLLPLLPIYEDSTLIAYDITHPLPVYYDGFPTSLTRDVDLARFDIQHDSVGMEWQLQVLAILLGERVTPLTCQIRLIGENGDALETPLTMFEALPDKKGGWAAGDLAMQETTLSLSPTLEPGEYRWIITCPEESAHYTAPETLHVSRDGHMAYLRRSLNLRYGDAIQLLGYRWRTERTNLQVNILWKALNNLDTEYKVFIHLLNASEEIVRQYDAIPCNWQCPTSHWQAGDIVPDMATISLQGLPAGEYRLAVGLYYLATQERLPARGPENKLYPNSYFVLPDIFVVSDNYR